MQLVSSRKAALAHVSLAWLSVSGPSVHVSAAFPSLSVLKLSMVRLARPCKTVDKIAGAGVPPVLAVCATALPSPAFDRPVVFFEFGRCVEELEERQSRREAFNPHHVHEARRDVGSIYLAIDSLQGDGGRHGPDLVLEGPVASHFLRGHAQVVSSLLL